MKNEAKSWHPSKLLMPSKPMSAESPPTRPAGESTGKSFQISGFSSIFQRLLRIHGNYSASKGAGTGTQVDRTLSPVATPALEQL